MNVSHEKTLSLLNDLIGICRDGQQGFRTAAEDTKDAELSRLFLEYSTQRAEFIRELQSRARSLGGDPDKNGSLSGAAHRGWINLKAALDSNEPEAVLAECERGEDVAVEAFRAVLQENIDPVTRGMASRQYVGVQAAHDRVKQLRGSATYQKV